MTPGGVVSGELLGSTRELALPAEGAIGCSLAVEPGCSLQHLTQEVADAQHISDDSIMHVGSCGDAAVRPVLPVWAGGCRISSCAARVVRGAAGSTYGLTPDNERTARD